jgi:inhibitor of KinA
MSGGTGGDSNTVSATGASDPLHASIVPIATAQPNATAIRVAPLPKAVQTLRGSAEDEGARIRQNLMNFSPLGDRAVIIQLGSSIDEATHQLVRAVCDRLAQAAIPGLLELVPAFASVAVHYDPAQVPDASAGAAPASPRDRIVHALRAALAGVRGEALPPARLVEIPVCYGGALGPDLEDVARAHEMSADEVVATHTASDYRVYMVGFMPGFAYLGGLAERIATPRRSVPRTRVPAGTVGIGGSQTGVYPLESPGGWHLIGRTPQRMFLPAKEPPTLLEMGDRVRFRAIDRDEFDALDRA